MPRLVYLLPLLSPFLAAAQTLDGPVQIAQPNDGQSVVSFVQVISPETSKAVSGQVTSPLIFPQVGKVVVSRKWNEKEALISIPFENKALGELRIRGIQTTGSLYLVSFSSVVPVGGRGEILVNYSAVAGVNADKDLIRLLTNQGEKFVELTQDREPVLALSAEKLQWSVGEAAASKQISLVVRDGTVVPKSVRAYGTGNSAELRKNGNGGYSIVVTPASTSKPAQFPVIVEFEPALTGVPNVITCAVVLPE